MPSVQVASNLPLSVELIVVSIAESLLYDKPDRVDMDRVLRGLGLDASSNKQSETPLPPNMMVHAGQASHVLTYVCKAGMIIVRKREGHTPHSTGEANTCTHTDTNSN